MAILNFVQPEKVIMKRATACEGTFEFRPLEPGFGITVGNGLRRILLSSLEGFAISSVKIGGVDHEFSTIKGIVEDITEIILNCKKIRFKRQIENSEGEVVNASFKEQERITAGDLGKFISGFQILNPELVICNKEKLTPFTITFVIDRGRGYVPAEENKKSEAPMGTIAIDAIYTPIKNVKYTVENYRLEQKTDYEKLSLEIKTDGSIHPKDALTEASNILIQHLALFTDERIALESNEQKKTEDYDEEALHMRQLLNSNLADLGLSVRAQNCLKSSEIITLGQLVSKTENDLKKVRNFGIKTMNEINELLEVKSLQLGMELSKYKLDKE
ncbi:DNA-directed RNA polymerase subunit alpha [Bacteroidetes bacterium endosymbiont of Geopemphigus sp.]|uniref:DNA-directed RNA polymerase subunit alpha n=1 Tax=Bacteroidetes bacterium endosymbiont of Geopemphigus sp. TaxID=2047937 RepID=UPI000CD18B0A|nr:DNA-directed RNA polymerase subunit alpha [Bacteroidetes bacterium endosymbiont of Geopemphigus sp.]